MPKMVKEKPESIVYLVMLQKLKVSRAAELGAAAAAETVGWQETGERCFI